MNRQRPSGAPWLRCHGIAPHNPPTTEVVEQRMAVSPAARARRPHISPPIHLKWAAVRALASRALISAWPKTAPSPKGFIALIAHGPRTVRGTSKADQCLSGRKQSQKPYRENPVKRVPNQPKLAENHQIPGRGQQARSSKCVIQSFLSMSGSAGSSGAGMKIGLSETGPSPHLARARHRCADPLRRPKN